MQCERWLSFSAKILPKKQYTSWFLDQISQSSLLTCFCFEKLITSYLYFEVRLFRGWFAQGPLPGLSNIGATYSKEAICRCNFDFKMFSNRSNPLFENSMLILRNRKGKQTSLIRLLERESCLTSRLSRRFTMLKSISVGSNSILFKQSISIVLDLSGGSGGDSWRYKASGLGGHSIGEAL
jgi:hypothetical protein